MSNCFDHMIDFFQRSYLHFCRVKLSREIEVLNKFMRLLDTNPDKAYYGYLHVQKANEELAIDSLLISDGLFRSSDVVTRKKYVELVESVREKGGTVYVFSTMHVSGQVCTAGYSLFMLPGLDFNIYNIPFDGIL